MTMKRFIKTMIIICIVAMMAGCYKGDESEVRLETLYEDEAIGIYNSQLIDTYLIASALYFDFESDWFIKETSEIGRQVKSYFEPYKDHSFIKGMGKYVEEAYGDISFKILIPLTTYCYGNELEGEFEGFLGELKQFYKDTKAEHFFRKQEGYNKKIKEGIEKDFQEKDLNSYIQAMEGYVGNKESYYPETKVGYGILTSLYRPNGASFYSIDKENAMEFICFTGISEESIQEEVFSTEVMVENAIHEYLHMYINSGVERQESLIQSLVSDKKVTDYVGSLYQNMPWNRVVDENIVRAVETRIYAQVLDNGHKAYEQILKKEIEWGGFKKVGKLYKTLKDYEENRDKYPIIDDYMPELINGLLKEFIIVE